MSRPCWRATTIAATITVSIASGALALHVMPLRDDETVWRLLLVISEKWERAFSSTTLADDISYRWVLSELAEGLQEEQASGDSPCDWLSVSYLHGAFGVIRRRSSPAQGKAADDLIHPGHKRCACVRMGSKAQEQEWVAYGRPAACFDARLAWGGRRNSRLRGEGCSKIEFQRMPGGKERCA